MHPPPLHVIASCCTADMTSSLTVSVLLLTWLHVQTASPALDFVKAPLCCLVRELPGSHIVTEAFFTGYLQS